MGTSEQGDLSVLLGEVRAGRPEAQARLVAMIYDELRRMARRLMRRERPDHTLQASAVVNEALLRLLGGEALAGAQDRRYLFGAAAQAMRQVLVDHARRRRTSKRTGDRARMPLDGALAAFDDRGLDIISLHEALEQLAQAHPRPAQVVELRFFGGLSVPDVAGALGVSDTTVESDWRFARAWLRGQLGETPG
jgi:RNA polymerase sigma factor (TIGR02999 family)